MVEKSHILAINFSDEDFGIYEGLDGTDNDTGNQLAHQ